MTPAYFWSFGLGVLFVAMGISVLLIAYAIKRMIDEARGNVSLILRSVEDNVKGVREITRDIDGKLEKTNRFFEIMDQIGRGLKTPAAILSRFFEAASVEAGALLYGIREGIKAFYRN